MSLVPQRSYKNIYFGTQQTDNTVHAWLFMPGDTMTGGTTSMHLTNYAKATTVRMSGYYSRRSSEGERDRQRTAEEIAEQREEKLARRRETDRASRQLYVLPRRDTHAWIRTSMQESIRDSQGETHTRGSL